MDVARSDKAGCTVTATVQDDERACASVAVHDTAVVPTGMSVPVSVVQVVVTGDVPPRSVGFAQVTGVGALSAESTVSGAGQDSTGGPAGGVVGAVGPGQAAPSAAVISHASATATSLA
jgi:hypothetical protein